ELSVDDAIAKLNALNTSHDVAASDALFGMFDDLDDSLFGMFDALEGFAPLDAAPPAPLDALEALEPLDDDALDLPIFSSGLEPESSRALSDEALEEVDPLATSALPQVGARDDAMAIMEELEELDEVGELGALEELRESAEFDALSLMGGLESLSELSDSADLDESLEPFDPGDAWA